MPSQILLHQSSHTAALILATVMSSTWLLRNACGQSAKLWSRTPHHATGCAGPIYLPGGGCYRHSRRPYGAKPLQLRRRSHSVMSVAAASPVWGMGIPCVMRAGTHEYASI